MIFEKAITIQEEAEKIAQVVTVMAHQGTRYTLEKQVFVQASHAEQSWQVPFTPKDSFAAAARKRPRLANSLATSQHYRDRRFDVSKTFTDSQLSLAGFGFAF